MSGVVVAMIVVGALLLAVGIMIVIGMRANTMEARKHKRRHHR